MGRRLFGGRLEASTADLYENWPSLCSTADLYEKALAAQQRPRIYPIWQRRHVFRTLQEGLVTSPLGSRPAITTPLQLVSLMSDDAEEASNASQGPFQTETHLLSPSREPLAATLERDLQWVMRSRGHSSGPTHRRPRSAHTETSSGRRMPSRQQALSKSPWLTDSRRSFSHQSLGYVSSTPTLHLRSRLPLRTDARPGSPARLFASRLTAPKPPPFTVPCPPRLHSFPNIKR